MLFFLLRRRSSKKNDEEIFCKFCLDAISTTITIIIFLETEREREREEETRKTIFTSQKFLSRYPITKPQNLDSFQRTFGSVEKFGFRRHLLRSKIQLFIFLHSHQIISKRIFI